MIFPRAIAIIAFSSWIYLIFYTITTKDFSWIIISYIYFKIVVGLFGNQISQHRYFSHQNFEVTRPKKLFLYFISLTTGISPRDYALIHRHHHAYSDLRDDVHSVHNSFYDIFYPLTGFKKYKSKILKSSILDAELKKINKNFRWIIFCSLCCIGFISLKVLFFICLSGIAWNYIHMILIRVLLVHIELPFSYRNYETDDNSWNNKILQFIDTGEGLHNNHHFKPEHYDQAHKPGEFDFAAFVIKHLLETKKNEAPHL